MKESSRKIFYTEMESPIGYLTIASTAKGICWIDFGKSKDSLPALQRWSKRWISSDQFIVGDKELQEAKEQLQQYFEKKRKMFDIPIDLYGTSFQKLVWQSLITIPYGQVLSYKDIAIQINAPKAVRAIGGANHQNPVPIIIPCHRVIGTNGNLVGYSGGIDIKRSLLTLEGFQIQGN